MPKKNKKSWFKRHKIMTGIGGFFLFLIILGMFSSDSSNDFEDVNSDQKEEFEEVYNQQVLEEQEIPTSETFEGEVLKGNLEEENIILENKEDGNPIVDEDEILGRYYNKVSCPSELDSDLFLVEFVHTYSDEGLQAFYDGNQGSEMRQEKNIYLGTCFSGKKDGENINYLYCHAMYTTEDVVENDGFIIKGKQYKIETILDKRTCEV